MKCFIYKTKFSDGEGIKIAIAQRENSLKWKRLQVGCSNGLGINPTLTLQINYLKYKNQNLQNISLFYEACHLQNQNFLWQRHQTGHSAKRKLSQMKKTSSLVV
jgi:hypothetical protein